MKYLRRLYTLLLSSALALTACTSDDGTVQGGGQEPVKDGKVQVRLTLSPAGTSKANTRGTWNDGLATDDEMMNLWTVVIVKDATDEVVEIQSCRPSSPYAEIDDVTELTPGTYRFYSFANIGHSDLERLLSLPSGSVPDVAEGTADQVSSIKAEDYTSSSGGDSGMGTVGGDNSNSPATRIKATVNGNKFDPTSDNGLGAKGIPMSNVQKKTIESNTKFDLIVVRMLAKIELRLFNVTGADVKVKSITFSDVTKNETNNLFLLPTLTNTSGSTPDEMAYTHKDIKPHVNATNREDVTLTSGLTVKKEYSNPTYETAEGKYESVVFYVNESSAPGNPDHLFNLTLDLDNSDFRYSLINQTGSATKDNDAWDYIARNDYRIIPIVLDDYKLELIPYDFPAIGVYPASVKQIATNLYEMTFHDYGHFHLLPKVTRGTTVIDFSSTIPSSGTAWTLTDNDFSKSWFTATTKGGAWVTDGNPDGFYRPTGATNSDGDEVGSVPFWYLNDGADGPQWDPDEGTTYRPFIFGYIDDPGGTLSADKKIYHEFRAKLYVDGSYRKDMIYRFYMTLSKDQMSYARGSRPARRSHN